MLLKHGRVFFFGLSLPLSLFEVHVDSTAVLMRDLGVSGFQVPLLWEGRWVTGLMNSDGRQLLINQETVCQWARRKTAAPAARTEIHTDLKNTQQAQRAGSCRCTHHRRTHAHTTPFISPSSQSPVPSVEQRPILSFPPDAVSRMCLLPMCWLLPHRGRAPRSIWKHLPDVNSEWVPGSKRCKRLRRRRRICIRFGGNDCHFSPVFKTWSRRGGKKKKTKRKETHFSCHPFVSSPQAFHFAALYSRLQKTRWLTLRKSEWVSVLFIIFLFHVQLQNNCGSACKRRTKGYHGNVCSPAMAAEPHRNIAQWRSYRPQTRGICFHFIADSRNSKGKKNNKNIFCCFVSVGCTDADCGGCHCYFCLEVQIGLTISEWQTWMTSTVSNPHPCPWFLKTATTNK